MKFNGIGRTGKMLATDYEDAQTGVRIRKALSGGVLLSLQYYAMTIMLCVKPGEHGSTFGGNPLSAAVAKALKVILDEGLIENAYNLGKIFRINFKIY